MYTKLFYLLTVTLMTTVHIIGPYIYKLSLYTLSPILGPGSQTERESLQNFLF